MEPLSLDDIYYIYISLSASPMKWKALFQTIPSKMIYTDMNL